MLRGASAAAKILTAIGVCLGTASCASEAAQPTPHVTVTETVQVEVTRTASMEPVYGQINPEVETLLAEVCQYVADNEPSWDDLQEYGPYEEYPIQADMVALAAKRAEETYRWAFDRLNYLEQGSRANAQYGMAFGDISNRATYAGVLARAAERYLDSNTGYEAMYYWWAAYAASIEMNVRGCSDYIQ